MDFLEKRKTQDLQDFSQTALDSQFLLEDGHQDINRDGDPDLGLHSVLGGPVKSLDPKILLDPFEKKLHPPAAFVKLGNRQSGQEEVVGQEREAFVRFGVEETDAPEFLRISFGRIESREPDDLIREESSGSVDRLQIKSLELEIAFGANDKEGQSLMKEIETLEIEITPIQDIKGTGLGYELVQDIDIVDFSFCNLDKRRDRAPEVQKRMELDGGPYESRLGRIRPRSASRGFRWREPDCCGRFRRGFPCDKVSCAWP